MHHENITTISDYQYEVPAYRFNALDLEQELAWCERVINVRLQLYFKQDCDYKSVLDIKLPDFNLPRSPYSNFIVSNDLSFFERLVLILALVPSIKPQIFDSFLCLNELSNRPYTEFGCAEKGAGRVYATGGTLAFLYAGEDLIFRFEVQDFLSTQREMAAAGGVQQALLLEHCADDSLLMNTPLDINDSHLHLFTIAKPYRPELSEDFPAKRVTTDNSWEDAALDAEVMEQLQDIEGWVKYGGSLTQEWGLGGKVRPGYRALFYGPPGTGKTMTAGLLGKSTGRDVYQVDLSLVVSKYIGDTEKNLEKVFSLAEDKSWILFFDEADALFGKRIEAASSNDQFANQNVAYLLQRIEQFNGIVILASNLKNNFDNAFFRRFESIIYFPMPKEKERLAIWKKGLPQKARFSEEIDLNDIANKHLLSGASIINVIRYASLKAICRGGTVLSARDVDEGVRRESSSAAETTRCTASNHSELFS